MAEASTTNNAKVEKVALAMLSLYLHPEHFVDDWIK
jgi:hypothetical protein